MNGDDIDGGTAQHLPGFFPHLQQMTVLLVHRHHRGLPKSNALAPHVNERAGGAEIDGNVSLHKEHNNLFLSSYVSWNESRNPALAVGIIPGLPPF